MTFSLAISGCIRVPQFLLPLAIPIIRLRSKFLICRPGFGAALTYNFDPHWGAEFDLGHNWGNSNYEITVSAGPRFMWRTEGSNLLRACACSVTTVFRKWTARPSNGIGAILGGGLDLPFNKNILLASV